jgi:hypothetical protein
MGSGEQSFRDAFPTLARLIDSTGSHKIEVTKSLAGSESVVIVKRTDNNRGWGLAWFADARELRGMRGLVYRADDSEFAPDNVAFVEEMSRRLSVIGVGVGALAGGVAYLQDIDDVFARGDAAKKRNYRRRRPDAALRRELRAKSF